MIVVRARSWDERRRHRGAVDVHDAAADFDRVAGDRDHALDVLARVDRTGYVNVMTSPRVIGRSFGVTVSMNRWSPIASVGYIDDDGVLPACNTKRVASKQRDADHEHDELASARATPASRRRARTSRRESRPRHAQPERHVETPTASPRTPSATSAGSAIAHRDGPAPAPGDRVPEAREQQPTENRRRASPDNSTHDDSRHTTRSVTVGRCLRSSSSHRSATIIAVRWPRSFASPRRCPRRASRSASCARRLRGAKLWDRERPATILRFLGVGGATGHAVDVHAGARGGAERRRHRDRRPRSPVAAQPGARQDRPRSRRAARVSQGRDLQAPRLGGVSAASVPSRPALETWLQIAIACGLLRPLGVAVTVGPRAERYTQLAGALDVDEFLAEDKPEPEPVIPTVAEDEARRPSRGPAPRRRHVDSRRRRGRAEWLAAARAAAPPLRRRRARRRATASDRSRPRGSPPASPTRCSRETTTRIASWWTDVNATPTHVSTVRLRPRRRAVGRGRRRGRSTGSRSPPRSRSGSIAIAPA